MRRSSSDWIVEARRRWVVRCHEVVDECDGDLAGLDADALLGILVDDVVLAVGTGRARLAVPGLGAGEGLQLERDVLRDMAHPRAFAESADEAAAATEGAGVLLERRHRRHQAVGEAGHQVRGEVLEDAEVDDHADDRLARPVVGAAHDARLDDAQLWARRRRRRRLGVRLGHRSSVSGQLEARDSPPSRACSRGLARRTRRRRSKR